MEPGAEITGSLFIDFPRLLVVALTSVIIFVLSIDLVRAKSVPTADSPSSFFPLDKVLSRAAFSVVYLFFSGTVAVLYAAIALDSGNVLTTLRKVLGNYAKDIAATDLKPSIEALFSAIPSWLEPLFVFIVFLLLFGDRVQKWLSYLRDAIIRSSGIYALIDSGARSTANELLIQSRNNYDAASAKLEALKGECPVPEEFVSKKDVRRLSYQMLWTMRDSIPADGFTEANTKLKRALDLPAPHHNRTRFARVAASTVAYAILVAIFIGLCPLLSEIAERNGILWSDTIGCLRLSLKFTMAFTLPLLLAVSVYPLRRRAYHNTETTFQSISTVATMQFSISFVLQEIYNIIEATIYFLNKETYSLLDTTTHILTFFYALCPIIAFAAILLFRKLELHPLIAYLLVSVVSGASFAFSDYIFELHNQMVDYYFIHQFVLGFWLASAFVVCGYIRRN